METVEMIIIVEELIQYIHMYVRMNRVSYSTILGTIHYRLMSSYIKGAEPGVNTTLPWEA